MTCCAVIDTNVLVSALLSGKPDAATVQVVARMLAGEIMPVCSDAILSEYRQVLHRPKFGFAEETVREFLDAIEGICVRLEPSPSGLTLPDMKDLPFYEVALDARSDDAWLVTGNLRHFPKQPFVVTPRQLLDILDK